MNHELDLKYSNVVFKYIEDDMFTLDEKLHAIYVIANTDDACGATNAELKNALRWLINEAIDKL